MAARRTTLGEMAITSNAAEHCCCPDRFCEGSNLVLSDQDAGEAFFTDGAPNGNLRLVTYPKKLPKS